MKKKSLFEIWRDKYGDDLAIIKWNEYIEKQKKCNTKNAYIEKYGEEIGEKKWNEFIEKSKQTELNMIKRYGEEIGKKKWNEYIQKHKKNQTLKGLIYRHGKEKGKLIYDNRVKKIKEANHGEKNPMSIQSISKRMNITTEEARKNTPCYNRKKEKHPLYNKKLTEETRKKISLGVQRSKPWGKKCKKQQSKCYEMVKKIFPSTIWECSIKTKTKYRNVDMFIPDYNLIIEYYGDYWHMNPSRFNENDYNNHLHLTAGEKWAYDEKRLNELRQEGYDIFIIWESDLKEISEEKLHESIKGFKTRKS